MSFTVVLVGAGDVGRTALVKAVLDRELARLLPGSAHQVVVTTAGVDALEGMPPSPLLVAAASRHGLDVAAHRATAMTRGIAESADLLLTMSRRQRAQLVLQHPGLRSRTFSLVELAVLLRSAGGVPPRPALSDAGWLESTLRALVPVAAEQTRHVPPAEDGRWDVTDPYAQGADVHDRVVDEVEDVVRALIDEVGHLLGSRATTAVLTA